MELRSPRLLLRDFDDADAARVFEYQQSPAYLQHYDAPTPTREDVRNLIERFRRWATEIPRTSYQLAITLDSYLIGTCGVRRLQNEPAEFGCELDPRFWGHGYALEASATLLTFARDELQIHRILRPNAPGQPRRHSPGATTGLRHDGERNPHAGDPAVNRLDPAGELRLAALDVHYAGSDATAACILFAGWRATTPVQELVRYFSEVAPYEPGAFFRRELPCLTGILSRLPQRPDAVIIDGYVWLDPEGRPGLGAHLFRELGETTPIIGVAKSAFPGAPAVEILRGQSRTPLYITAAGTDVDQAAENVRGMGGSHRIPDMLKRADRLCRTSSA
ncbi:MAG TPA: endonuclease V [Thermoanaerobaculia bacterium]